MDSLIVAAIVAAFASLIGSACATLIGLKNHSKLMDIHVDVNGRISELIAAVKKSSYQEGEKAGEKAGINSMEPIPVVSVILKPEIPHAKL